MLDGSNLVYFGWLSPWPTFIALISKNEACPECAIYYDSAVTNVQVGGINSVKRILISASKFFPQICDFSHGVIAYHVSQPMSRGIV